VQPLFAESGLCCDQSKSHGIVTINENRLLMYFAISQMILVACVKVVMPLGKYRLYQMTALTLH
jgi:hypothetical protein